MRYKKIIAYAFLIASLTGSVDILANYWAVSPTGSGVLLDLYPIIEVLLILLAVLTAIITFPVLLIKQCRKDGTVVLCFCVTFLLTLILCMNVGRKVRMSAFAKLANKSKLLIVAIKKYQGKYGEPPKNLQKLAPEFLKEVPKTGMNAYPVYEYEIVKDKRFYYGNPWVLKVFTPSGLINFDEFLYFPKQNYPVEGYGGWLEEVEDWAYVHE